MSAYASFPFSSYLSPTNVSEPTSNAVQNSKDVMNKAQSNERKSSAISIKVKSANVNVGVLAKPNRSKRPNASKQHIKRAGPSSCFSLPDDAVLFKLSICYNGRKYTATRSFAKFIKLRYDLNRELNECNYLKPYRATKYSQNITEDKATILLPQLPDSISDQTDGNCHFALPSVSSGISMAMAAASVPHYNVVGSGGITSFTKLQSLLLCYYCPLIECWLKQIMDIIDYDTSPCFNNFLWEPLRDDNDDSNRSSVTSICSSTHSNSIMEPQSNSGSSPIRKKQSFGSTISLCSIHENLEEFDN